MEYLIGFLKSLAEFDSNYDPEEALSLAQDQGIIQTFEQKDYQIVGERRWGHESETVFLIDGRVGLRFDIYEATSHEGDDPDELLDIVKVKEVEKIVKVWEEV